MVPGSVTLMIIILLCSSFIPAMTEGGSEGLAVATGATGRITKDDIVQVFFHAALVQSVGMGLVTGVFEEGNLASGVKHIFIMVLVTWFIFKIAVGI